MHILGWNNAVYMSSDVCVDGLEMSKGAMKCYDQGGGGGGGAGTVCVRGAVADAAETVPVIHVALCWDIKHDGMANKETEITFTRR